jgi:hypothetical protein
VRPLVFTDHREPFVTAKDNPDIARVTVAVSPYPLLMARNKRVRLDVMSSHTVRPFLVAVEVLVDGCEELLTGDFFATFCDASAGYVILVPSTLAKEVRT